MIKFIIPERDESKMNTYKVLKALQDCDCSFNHLMTAKEISEKAGFDITDNDLIYFKDYVTKGYKTIDGKSQSAYCLLLSGINFIENYEDNLKLKKSNRINLIIAIFGLISSIIAAIASILVLL